jgi:O-antigen/teichoic acid export membrane protein
MFTLIRLVTGLLIVGIGGVVALLVNSALGSVIVLGGGVFVSLGSTAALIARRRYVAAAGVLIGEKATALLSVVALGWCNAVGPLSLPLIVGLSGLIAGAIATIILHSHQITFHKRVFTLAARGQWRGSLHFGIASVAPAFLLLDTFIVSSICGASDAGAYAVGSRLLAPLSVVSTTLAQTLMPVLAVGGPSARLSLSSPRKLFVMLLGVVVAVILLCVLAPAALVRVLGPEYAAADWPIRLFVLNAAVVLVTRALATALQAWHYEYLVSMLVAASVLLALLGVFVGATLGGPASAAAGVVLANSVLAVALIVAARRVRTRSLTSAAVQASYL